MLHLDDYFFTDSASPTLELGHLQLRVLTLLTNVYRPRATCVLPPGIIKLTLGSEDIEDALAQAAVTASVRELVLNLEHLDDFLFQHAWPARRVRLPRLIRVTAYGCQSHEVAAALGQRCADVSLQFLHTMLHDICTDACLVGAL